MQNLPVSKIIVLFALLALAVPAESLDACPNCREALLNSGRAIGYALSILVLMSAPFLLAGFWTTLIVRLRRQAALEQNKRARPL